MLEQQSCHSGNVGWAPRDFNLQVFTSISTACLQSLIQGKSYKLKVLKLFTPQLAGCATLQDSVSVECKDIGTPRPPKQLKRNRWGAVHAPLCSNQPTKLTCSTPHTLEALHTALHALAQQGKILFWLIFRILWFWCFPEFPKALWQCVVSWVWHHITLLHFPHSIKPNSFVEHLLIIS